MRRIYLNNGWIFYPFWTDACIRTSVAAQGEKVRIPHAAAFSYKEGHRTACSKGPWGYVRMLSVPESFKEKALWLTFEGVAWHGDVFVNGTWVISHDGGYTPFSVDISPYIRYGCENRVAVRVDSGALRPSQVMKDVSSDVFAGGIYRDVYIEVKNRACIEDVFIRTRLTGLPSLTGPGQMAVSVRFSENVMKGSGIKGYFIQMAVFNEADDCLYIDRYSMDPILSGQKHGLEKNKGSESGKNRTMTVRISLPQVDYWDISRPSRYFAEVTLWDGKGRILDSCREVFGFREMTFKRDGAWLNGRKVPMTGLERHQDFPYIGFAAPESMQKMDADLLKDVLGVQAVRTAFGPPSEAFICQCDKKGLLVFMGLPVDGTQEGTDLKPIREMIRAFRNHPSVILWEIYSERESKDVQKALRVARRMDPTRGVRFLNEKRHSSAFPAQIGDNDFCRMEQALECMHTWTRALEEPSLTGDFIYSASDHPVRAGFGGRDGICYDGVTDMFRNPKYAAWIYASQGDAPVCQVVMPQPWGHKNVCSYVWVFTNCDYVRVFREGKCLGTFEPDRELFRGLLHPPVRIPFKRLYGEGEQWRRMGAGFSFEFIKNDQVMGCIRKCPSDQIFLKVWSSHTCLLEKNSYDMALIHIEAVDENGETAVDFNGPVRIMTRGPAAVLGPDMISLRGGFGGTLIRTLGGRGKVKVTVFSPQAGAAEIYLDVKKEKLL